MNQSTLFRGVYEFEDPSGVLVAGKSPYIGSADLYDGTVIVVRPGQVALFVYQGKIADTLGSGTHTIKTGNFPIITRLANWKFGFTSPLRCEIWFFSVANFLSRRWGTSNPIPITMSSGRVVPIRAYGNFGFHVVDPKTVLTRLVGTKASFAVTDIEEFIQGQIVECFAEAVVGVRDIENLSSQQDTVSKRLEQLIRTEIDPFGIRVTNVQVLSMLPTQEILDAMNARVAMDLIGNKQEYLLYRAANSLDAVKEHHNNDSMQMMLGLMIGKGLMGADYHAKEKASQDSQREDTQKIIMPSKKACPKCNTPLGESAKFCAECGGKL